MRSLPSPSGGQALRRGAVVLSLLLCGADGAVAQVSFGMSMPGVSIGVNMPVYPQLVRVPNYPVYYAPGAQANFFFYDGMYWVYQQDNWYASSWYNGPWRPISPQAVPVYVLRVPVRYYRDPPRYFQGWGPDQPPRWGEHWGNDWSRQRSGWDHWDRRAAPAPAPLPHYQRQYSGDRYPQVEQQQSLHGRNYGYQPRDAAVRQQYERQDAPMRSGDRPPRPGVQARPQNQQTQPQWQPQQQQPQQQPWPQQSQRQRPQQPQQQWPQQQQQQPWAQQPQQQWPQQPQQPQPQPQWQPQQRWQQ